MSLADRRPARSCWIGCLVAGALALLLLLGPSVTAARARWSAPFEFTAPGTLDVTPAQLAVAGSGAAAAAFGLVDVDVPGSARAYLVTRSAAGVIGHPLAVPGASQVLALTAAAGGQELLTGTSRRGQTCCSSAQALQVSGGGSPQRARTLVGGLAGPAQGRLLTLKDGQMLAAVATQRGVWVIQSARANRFAGQHLLTRRGVMPQSLDAAWLGAESTIVVWTAAGGNAGTADPRTVSYATGSRTRAPSRVRTAVTVPGGHRIDELGVAARRGGGATLAWVESWSDKWGTFHSTVRALDIAPHAAPRTLSAANRLASGLSVAGDVSGDVAIAWSSCTGQGACATDVSGHASGATFGPARALGAVDPSQAPAVAVGGHGQVVAGWVRGGHPVAATTAHAGRPFGAPVSLSSTTFALDLTVAMGSGRRAVAAWTQGTLNPSVVGAATDL